jgi:anthranilate synthase component 2
MTASTPRPGDGARVFMIDNYDSFTYNLVQYLGELGAGITVKRNDHVTIAEIEAARPTHLVVSPGPCTPNEAGISMEAISHFGAARTPVLGVCLGHQAIGQAFGGKVVHAKTLMHGKTSPIHHAGGGVFRGLPSPFVATRYHSLAVEREALPDCLEVTAWTEDGEIMGLAHKSLAVQGVQFHPESILTEHGHALLRNFLNERRSA